MQNRGGSGYAWATPPPTGTGRSVGGGLFVGTLSGWIKEVGCIIGQGKQPVVKGQLIVLDHCFLD